MSNLLTAILFPVLLGIGLLVSLQAKKKKAGKNENFVEFKSPSLKLSDREDDVNLLTHSYIEKNKITKKQPLLIRLPKLVE